MKIKSLFTSWFQEASTVLTIWVQCLRFTLDTVYGKTLDSEGPGDSGVEGEKKDDDREEKKG